MADICRGTLLDMGKNLYPARSLRGVPNELWSTFLQVCKAQGTDASTVLRQYVQFHVGEITPEELPAPAVRQPVSIQQAAQQQEHGRQARWQKLGSAEDAEVLLEATEKNASKKV